MELFLVVLKNEMLAKVNPARLTLQTNTPKMVTPVNRFKMSSTIRTWTNDSIKTIIRRTFFEKSINLVGMRKVLRVVGV